MTLLFSVQLCFALGATKLHRHRLGKKMTIEVTHSKTGKKAKVVAVNFLFTAKKMTMLRTNHPHEYVLVFHKPHKVYFQSEPPFKMFGTVNAEKLAGEQGKLKHHSVLTGRFSNVPEDATKHIFFITVYNYSYDKDNLSAVIKIHDWTKKIESEIQSMKKINMNDVSLYIDPYQLSSTDVGSVSGGSW